MFNSQIHYTQKIGILLSARFCTKYTISRPILGLILGGSKCCSSTRYSRGHVCAHHDNTECRYQTDTSTRILCQGNWRLDVCMFDFCVCCPLRVCICECTATTGPKKVYCTCNRGMYRWVMNVKHQIGSVRQILKLAAIENIDKQTIERKTSQNKVKQASCA